MIDLYSLGLLLIPEFLTESEELTVLSSIPQTQVINKHTRNSIKRYGSNIPYKNQIESDTIPKYLESLSDKIISNNLLKIRPNSVSINEYVIGNAIAPHIDSMESGEVITIISLLSDATMVFTKDDLEQNIVIPSRSLIQLKNEIRYQWKHSILPVKNKRYSIVFRNG